LEVGKDEGEKLGNEHLILAQTLLKNKKYLKVGS
jgi:hypothetical protein